MLLRKNQDAQPDRLSPLLRQSPAHTREQALMWGCQGGFSWQVSQKEIVSLCPEIFTKLLMEIEVTAEGQIIPSALAGLAGPRVLQSGFWLRCENKSFFLKEYKRKSPS